MRFDVLTLFPEVIRPYTEVSILDRAQEHNYVDIRLHNIRDFTSDKHRRVDDKPFGGGPGMVLQVEPIYNALQTIVHETRTIPHVVLFGAGGEQFTQEKAHSLQSNQDHIVCICGRYEGVDARVEEFLVHETLSVGPYVLTGGELPALTVIDAVTRLVPGVLGNQESLEQESFSEAHTVEYPQYTRPATFSPSEPDLITSASHSEWQVPEALLSGDHAAIAQWREEHKTKKTSTS